MTKIPKHGCRLVSRTACLGNRFELSLDALGIILLASADNAHDYDMTFRMDAVDDAMASYLVFPIARERAAQQQSLSFRVNG